MNNNEFFKTVDCNSEKYCSSKNTLFCKSCICNKLVVVKDYFCELKPVIDFKNK
ncbi:hypothetical protein [Clostridium botulinum]|uniref:hypothetical protein n=1 Tax=Clostridium botulinum TaxID=1491 RepID=UPI001C9B4ECE|nr:hypothetical protein [Clostridium botulinum]MBY6838770.1 hypothetical protein [Clostridium botulinum]